MVVNNIPQFDIKNCFFQLINAVCPDVLWGKNTMAKVILYIATSEDGFVADKDGGVDWLPHPSDEHEDMGYPALMDRISAIVMGSRSYQQIIGFGDWAWSDKQAYVFTNQPLVSSNEAIRFIQDNVRTFMERIARNLTQDIWLLGGAALAKSFAKEQQIDECIITVIPKKLGNGIALEVPFGNFDLKQSKQFKDRIMQHTFVKKSA
jgi:dihydrofolate reductase